MAVGLPIICALLAAGVFLHFALPQHARQSPVVVAARPLPVGVALAPGDLTVIQVPKALPGELADPTPLYGERLSVPLAAGEALEAGDAQTAATAPLEERLPQGERAVSLSLPPVAALGYTIRAGDRVDIVASFNTGSGVPGAPISMVILPDVPILDVSAPQGSATTGIVTVEVTAQGSATLELAAQLGTVDLALRPASDRGTEKPLQKAGSLP